MGCQDNPKEVSSFLLFFAKLGSFCNTVSGSWLNPLATVHLVVDSSRGKFSRWTCFVFAEMVPIGVCSTLKNGRWEKREGRERKFRETDPLLIPIVVQETNAHYSNRTWRQRYAPTAILNRIAFYPAGSFQVICSGECLDPQMTNLPAWYECQEGKRLEWAEPSRKCAAQQKGYFCYTQGKENNTKTSVSPMEGVRQCSSWQQEELPSLRSASVFCQEGWDASHKEYRGHWAEGIEVQNKYSDCQTACPFSGWARASWPWWIKLHATDGMRLGGGKNITGKLSRTLEKMKHTSKWKGRKTEVLPMITE